MFFCLTLWAVYSVLPQQTECLDPGPNLTSNSGSPATMLIPLNNSDTSANKLKVTCDGMTYGKNLKVPSCRKVFGYMRHDSTQYTFVERLSGIPGDVLLPLRTYSSKYSTDAPSLWIKSSAAWPTDTVHLILTLL